MNRLSNPVSKLPTSRASGVTSPRGPAKPHETQTRQVSQHYAKTNIGRHDGAFNNVKAFESNLELLTQPNTQPMLPDDIDTLDKLDQGATVIDAGCGLGVAARLAAQKGMNVIAYTPSPIEAETLNLHQAAHPDRHFGVSYLQASSLSELKVQPGTVDKIRLDRVLPYVDQAQRDEFFQDASQALKPGGEVFCSFYHDSSRIEHGSTQSLDEIVRSISQAGLTPYIKSVAIDASDAQGSDMKMKVDPMDEATLTMAVLKSEDGGTGLANSEEAIKRIGVQCANDGAAVSAVRVNIVAYKPVA